MFITIIIFIIILGILVFVHEFGHFIVAKKSGMKVEEFGFGFPPRMVGIQKVDGNWRWVWGHREPMNTEQTVYSVNWIPLGGFVRILGENNEHEDHPGSFISKGFWPRFFTLVAGVCMNVILAFLIFSFGYLIGLPVAINSKSDLQPYAIFTEPQIAVLSIIKDLPADKAGIKPNDIIVSVDGQAFSSVTDIQKYVTSHGGKQITLQVERGGQNLEYKVTPNPNPGPDQGPTGIQLSLVGKLKYPFVFAFWEGFKTTGIELKNIFAGLYELFKGHVGFSSLGGPVKIAKITGEVASLGFVYLMQFTAFLSLNLAVLNILPFPALDGGRVLFLFIEKIRGKRNNQKVEQIVNTAGFAFLILLMVVVTINDVFRK